MKQASRVRRAARNPRDVRRHDCGLSSRMVVWDMHNWSTDTAKLATDPEQYAIWRLEQLINFGTDGEKISADELRTRWDRLTLDEAKRQFLGFLLWGENYFTRGK